MIIQLPCRKLVNPKIRARIVKSTELNVGGMRKEAKSPMRIAGTIPWASSGDLIIVPFWCV